MDDIPSLDMEPLSQIYSESTETGSNARKNTRGSSEITHTLCSGSEGANPHSDSEDVSPKVAEDTILTPSKFNINIRNL